MVAWRHRVAARGIRDGDVQRAWRAESVDCAVQGVGSPGDGEQLVGGVSYLVEYKGVRDTNAIFARLAPLKHQISNKNTLEKQLL